MSWIEISAEENLKTIVKSQEKILHSKWWETNLIIERIYAGEKSIVHWEE